MDKSAQELMDTPVDTLTPKQRERLQLELLKEILNTLRYIELRLRPASSQAAVIELETTTKPKTGQ